MSRDVMQWMNRIFGDGWFTRAMMIAVFWFAYDLLNWSEAFASTSLYSCQSAAPGGKCDLLGVAAVIGATAAAPLGLLTLALNKYMDMRSSQPVVVTDRRKTDEQDQVA